MVIRGKPKDLDNFVRIDNDMFSYDLSQHGFFPTYIDKNSVYYKKTDKIIKYMKGEK